MSDCSSLITQFFITRVGTLVLVIHDCADILLEVRPRLFQLYQLNDIFNNLFQNFLGSKIVQIYQLSADVRRLIRSIFHNLDRHQIR